MYGENGGGNPPILPFFGPFFLHNFAGKLHKGAPITQERGIVDRTRDNSQRRPSAGPRGPSTDRLLSKPSSDHGNIAANAAGASIVVFAICGPFVVYLGLYVVFFVASCIRQRNSYIRGGGGRAYALATIAFREFIVEAFV